MDEMDVDNSDEESEDNSEDGEEKDEEEGEENKEKIDWTERRKKTKEQFDNEYDNKDQEDPQVHTHSLSPSLTEVHRLTYLDMEFHLSTRTTRITQHNTTHN